MVIRNDDVVTRSGNMLGTMYDAGYGEKCVGQITLARYESELYRIDQTVSICLHVCLSAGLCLTLLVRLWCNVDLTDYRRFGLYDEQTVDEASARVPGRSRSRVHV